MPEIWGCDLDSGPSSSSSSIGSGDLPRLDRTEEEKNVCRPTLAPPPMPATPGVTSRGILGRFLEIPDDGSTWMDGVLMLVAAWNVFGPRIGEERSSPYAARIGGGEEGRWRLSIVSGRKRGWTCGLPTRAADWASSRYQSPIVRISRVQLSAQTSPRFPENLDEPWPTMWT